MSERSNPPPTRRSTIRAAPLAPRELLTLQLREHLALEAVQNGTAQREDLHTLHISTAVAHELAMMGYGRKESAIVSLARSALAVMATPVAPGLCTSLACLPVLRRLVAYHDAQRDAVTRRDYVNALDRVQQRSSTVVPIEAARRGR